MACDSSLWPVREPSLDDRDQIGRPPPPGSPGVLRRVQAKEHLFLEGDRRRCSFEIVMGAVACFKVQQDGRRQISRFALPGDFLGLGWGDTEPYCAEATSDSIVKCRPHRIALGDGPKDFGAAEWVGRKLAEELNEARELARVMALGGALERVAEFMVRMTSRIGSNGTPRVVVLPMTRSDIGDHLGLTLETVSRELSRLKQMRIIEIDQIVRISIVDPARLKAVAQFDCELGRHRRSRQF